MRVTVVDGKRIGALTAAALMLLALFIGLGVKNERAREAAALAPNKELPIYGVHTDEKKIAISFDAAWGDEKTLQILDILDEYDIKTTFFLVGFWVDKYPDHVAKIDEKGHEIGNHSTTHPHMSQLRADQVQQEVQMTSDKIKAITGKPTTLFRPPYGDYNNQLILTLKDMDHYPIQWSVDSLDWKDPGVTQLVKNATAKIKPGDIVLFHNNSTDIVQALPLILDAYKEKGLQVVPIGELIYKDNYTIDHAGMQKRLP